jgi:DNA-binding PucR family transcriptional regulator
MAGGALTRRTETVRLILDGAPIDERVAAGRLGYELTRRHTALVLWLDSPTGDNGELEWSAAAWHRNTVLQRIARATELLGHPPGDRRLAVMTALEIAHFVGPKVLTGYNHSDTRGLAADA